MLNFLLILAQGVSIDQKDTGLPPVAADATTLQIGLQLVFGVIGAVAILFIVVSALRLIVSGGDSQAVAKTRQSIIYAAIGLVIVVSAELIVTFVVGRL